MLDCCRQKGWTLEGTSFGRYQLLSLLGRGGMGEVWRAHDSVTDRVVAIKLLPAHFSDNEDFQRRFRREAHAAARLNTPHVVPIYDYGEIDGRLYVNMRLIEGRDLSSLIADGPLDPARAVRIVDGVAKALHAAHEAGFLHRDVKPSNVLVDRDDFAYLIDFGIARAADDTRMTKSGSMIGTLQYIAPERLDAGNDEDERADVYSLACLLYECLTGESPFGELSTPQLVAAHLHAPPPRPSAGRAGVPVQFDQVIATGMAKDPGHRYATTVDLADAARNAITVPMPRVQPAPLPVTEVAPLIAPSGNENAATVPGPYPPAVNEPAYQPAPPVQTPPAQPVQTPPAQPVETPPAPPLQLASPSPRPLAPAPPKPPANRRKAVLISGAVAVVVVATVVAVALAVTNNSPAGRSSQSGPTSSIASPDAASLLAQAIQSTRQLTSVHVVQTVTGKYPGTPIKSMTGDLTTTPRSAGSGREVITFAGSDLDTEFVVIDGVLYSTALSPGQWSDLGAASDIYDPTLLLNPDRGLANILANISDPKAAGQEMINGAQTVKITGQASADAVDKFFPATAATASVPTTVWIRQDGARELAQLVLEPSPGNRLQMTMSNWNVPVTVQKPPVS